MPLNPDREIPRAEQIKNEVMLHSDHLATLVISVAIVVAVTIAGAPIAVAAGYLLGVAVVVAIGLVK